MCYYQLRSMGINILDNRKNHSLKNPAQEDPRHESEVAYGEHTNVGTHPT